MSDMLAYLPPLPPLLAFCAMLVGLSGPSRRTGARGLRGITPMGWAVATVAAASLGLRLWQAHGARVERAKMLAVTPAETREALEDLLRIARYVALLPDLAAPGAGSDSPEDAALDDPRRIEALDAFHVSPRPRLLGSFSRPVPFRTRGPEPAVPRLPPGSASAGTTAAAWRTAPTRERSASRCGAIPAVGTERTGRLSSASASKPRVSSWRVPTQKERLDPRMVLAARGELRET